MDSHFFFVHPHRNNWGNYGACLKGRRPLYDNRRSRYRKSTNNCAGEQRSEEWCLFDCGVGTKGGSALELKKCTYERGEPGYTNGANMLEKCLCCTEESCTTGWFGATSCTDYCTVLEGGCEPNYYMKYIKGNEGCPRGKYLGCPTWLCAKCNTCTNCTSNIRITLCCC